MVDLQRRLPANRRFPVERRLVLIESGEVESAAFAAGKARPVEEDARIIDHPRRAVLRARFLRISEHPAARCGLVLLEPRWVEGHAERANAHGLLFIEQVRSDRATSLMKRGRGMIEDAFAAAVPDAGPVRVDEGDIDLPPGAVDRVDEGLENRRSI